MRVLDFSRVLAGPLCTMVLGDLGANVIKVERPGRGDDTRSWGPPFDERGESAYYVSINRNKISIAADLMVADRALVVELIENADVVVENFLPGTLERAGIESQTLLQSNPRLVWCSITGFGRASRRPGYDYVVQAETGWMAITGARAWQRLVWKRLAMTSALRRMRVVWRIANWWCARSRALSGHDLPSSGFARSKLGEFRVAW